jgi:hypothetical protein
MKPMNTRTRLLVVLLALFVLAMPSACSTDSVGFPDGDVDGDLADGDVSDGDATDGDLADGDVDGDATDGDSTVEVGFTPDALSPAAGEVVLTDATLEDDYLVVDVAANGFENVLGLAFRVRYDASVLRLAGAEIGDALESNARILAKQATPGESWIGVSNMNAETSAIGTPKRVCRLQFTFVTRRPTRIDFDPSPLHSLVADGDLKTIPALFKGGYYGPIPMEASPDATR